MYSNQFVTQAQRHWIPLLMEFLMSHGAGVQVPDGMEPFQVILPWKPSAHLQFTPAPVECLISHLADTQRAEGMSPSQPTSPKKPLAHLQLRPDSLLEFSMLHGAGMQVPVAFGPFHVILPWKPSLHLHAKPGFSFACGTSHFAA